MNSDILSLTKTLIQIPSVTGDIENSISILDVAKKILQEYSHTPFFANQIPSLLFTNKAKENMHFDLILNAHLDIVPADEKQYTPIETDGRLYGRGSFDMKGAAAVMILLFKELGKSLPYSLGLQLVTDEEQGGLYGTKYQVAEGVRGNFVIIGESTNFNIVHQSKGRILAKITATGEASHGAYPWRGRNAILNVYEAIERLLDHYPLSKNETGDTTINLSKIETSNDAYNKVPDNCVAYLDIRYAPQEAKTIHATLKSLLPPDIALSIILEKPAQFTKGNNPHILNLKKIGKEVLKRDLQVTVGHGSSDATYYTQVGCQAIEFGVFGGKHHHKDEYITTQSLYDYYQILKEFLMKFERISPTL